MPNARAIGDLVGQSFLLRPHGIEPTEAMLAALERTRAAGIVLFGDNVGTPAELHALVSAFQTRAKEIGLPPLLVAMDQEGGIVSRLSPPFTIVPSPMAQAATGDPGAARESAAISAIQLRAMGVNVNFAPAVDVNVNPANPVIGTRSFGEDPAAVSAFVVAAIEAYREHGIIATAKHFPGHGDTDIDSHHELPVIAHDRGRVERVELVPFRAAIEAQVPAIMTGHIVFPALDELPATLSSMILNGLLREELGFEGIIFSDALEMDAVNIRYDVEAAALAKAAGVDVVMPVGTLERQEASLAAMHEAAASGRIELQALRRTAERLDRLRDEYDLSYGAPGFDELPTWMNAAAQTIAARAVTVVQGQEALPLSREARLTLVDWARPRWSLVSEAVERTILLRTVMTAVFPRASCVVADAESSDEHLLAIDALAQASDAVVLVTRDAVTSEEQQRLIERLALTDAPLYHAAVRGPYDAGLVPNAAATLLTYGDPPASLQALVAVLAGEAKAAGRAPVTLLD
jgi:beta-N-acetylhexosaminidase